LNGCAFQKEKGKELLVFDPEIEKTTRRNNNRNTKKRLQAQLEL